MSNDVKNKSADAQARLKQLYAEGGIVDDEHVLEQQRQEAEAAESAKASPYGAPSVDVPKAAAAIGDALGVNDGDYHAAVQDKTGQADPNYLIEKVAPVAAGVGRAAYKAAPEVVGNEIGSIGANIKAPGQAVGAIAEAGPGQNLIGTPMGDMVVRLGAPIDTLPASGVARTQAMQELANWVAAHPKATQNDISLVTSQLNRQLTTNPLPVAGRRPRRMAEGGEVGIVEDAPPAPQATPVEVAAVNVVSPEGELGSISSAQLQDYLDSGFKVAEPHEVEAHFKEQDYSSPGQVAATALEGAGSGLLTSTGMAAIERGLGVDPEGIRAREEVNPVTHAAAEFAGFGAGALAGTGEAALLAKAGEAARGVVGAAGITNRVAADAIVSGFEGLLMGSDMVGAKAVREDPDLNAGHAALSIGLTGAMGAGMGAAAGALLRKFGFDKEVGMAAAEGEASIPEPQVFVSQHDAPKLEAGDLATGIQYSSEKPSVKTKIMEAIGLGKRASDAKLTEQVAAKHGLPVLEGMISDDKFVQMGEDMLRNSPTSVGKKRAAMWDEAYTGMDQRVQSALGEGSSLSKAEIGERFQAGLKSKIQEENAPIKAAYDVLKGHTENIPLSMNTGRIISEIEAMPESRLLGQLPGGSLLKGAVEGIGRAQTVDDLKVISSALNLPFTAPPAEKRVAAILKDKLNQLADDSIEVFAKHTAKTPEEKAAALALPELRKAANEAYRPFKEDLSKLAKALGKRNIGGAQDAIQFISELSPEQVTNRLFTKNNSQFLQFFEKKFPDMAVLMRDYQKGVLREAATKDGIFSPKRLFTAVGKLEPEIQQAIFSKAELATMRDMEHYLDKFPKNFNPSGTAHALNYRSHFADVASGATAGMALAGPLGGAIGAAIGHFRPELQDAAIEQFIKRAGASPRAAQAAALAKATLDGERMADKAVKSVLHPDKSMPANINVSPAAKKDLDKIVKEFQGNPEAMLNANANNPIPSYAQSFSATTARAVEYLASIRPDTAPRAPLDSKLPPSSFAKSKYDRALETAQQPLTVLKRIKQGTLTPDDITTLKTIYPAMYQSLSNKMMSQIVESVHKGTTIPYHIRLQLSSFLGQPLDSTMTPQSVQSIQMQAVSKGQDQPAQNQKAPAANKTEGLKKIGQAAQSPEQSKAAGRAKRNN